MQENKILSHAANTAVQKCEENQQLKVVIRVKNAPVHVPLQKEITHADLQNATDLMKACYDLDLEIVQLSLGMGDDTEATDKMGRKTSTYLFAGFNKMQYFYKEKYQALDKLDPEKMSKKDGESYRDMLNRFNQIMELLCNK